ncbi:MAG: ATP phosphoribosyltransferase regulatory subunit [Lachnospiraceae bacterium]|nr:ATP phosphoribosyltransferase regulatory subunit [Lachnospiraceae bacterium]
MLPFNNDLLHTPDGMRDTYGEEMAKKQSVIDRIKNRIHLYGYEDIQTPAIEFYDVFSSEVGTTPVRELYKLLDNEGNLLVLRPDFTPSVARCAAKYFADYTSPIRFTYSGSVFGNASSLQGKLCETTQMGAELINDDSVYADGEILALLIDSLLQAGLTQFQISVGNVEYFKGTCQAVGLDADTEMLLRDALSGKNYYAAEELLRARGYDRGTRNLFLKASRFVSTEEELSRFLTDDMHPQARAAIERLMELCGIMDAYGFSRYISYDLSLLSKYRYYTGIVFKGYTYGAGDAVASGGRYDGLLSHYGKDAAAIGVMIQIDMLMEALRRQNIPVETDKDRTRLEIGSQDPRGQIAKAMELRNEGCTVILTK